MEESWQIDRHIPLALIVTIILQTAAAVWWASSLNNRVSQLESFHEQSRPQESRLVIVEQRLGFIQETLKRIEDKLNK